MKINVNNPTYQFNRPFIFCGQEYSNSKSLVEAVLDNWDEAITSFKCDEWDDFWETYVEAEESVKAEGQTAFAMISIDIWDENNTSNIDVLFTKVIHYLEPALKEIPYFEPNSSNVSLWGAGQYESFFQRELSRDEKEYLVTLVSNDLIDSEERLFDAKKENILYSCNMLKEEIFTLFGYSAAEEEFHKVAFGVVERNDSVEIRVVQNVEQEDLVRVYQGVAGRLKHDGEFIYQGQRCSSLEEFGAIWKDECAKWSISEWKSFIEVLYEEKKDAHSFRTWLAQIKETKLLNDLEDWKREARNWEELNGGMQIDDDISIPDISTVIQWFDYLEWGDQKWHDSKLTGYEQEAEERKNEVKTKINCSAVEGFEKIMMLFYQYLQDAVKDMPKYESTVMGERLNGITSRCKDREQRKLRECDEQKRAFLAARNHEVLSHLNDERLLGTGNWSRRRVAVLACAPIQESYQKDCEAFLQLIEAGGEGCEPEQVQSYVEFIFERIYVKLVKSFDTPSEVVEYYFRLIEKLSQKMPETVQLSDILADSQYKYKELVRKYIEGHYKDVTIWDYTTSQDDIINEDILKDYQKKIKSLRALERKNVLYISFYENNIEYDRWREQDTKRKKIEEKWLEQGRLFLQAAKEWVEYFDENYNKKSIDEIYETGMALSAKLHTYMLAMKGKEKEWEQAVEAQNKTYYSIASARREYEAEWDRRKKEEAEKETKKRTRAAKRKAFLKKLIRGLLTLLALAVLVFVFCIVIKGVKNKYFTVWKVIDGKLVANYDSDSRLLSQDKFVERLDATITEDAVLELPPDASYIGDINLDYAASVIGDRMQKLVIPEGVTETTSEFTVVGATTLTEIEFPSTLTKLCGNFSETGLRSIRAENVYAVEGSVSYGSVFNGTECYGGAFSKNEFLKSVNLPMLGELEQYAFYDCYSLSDVNLPLVGTVGEYAFASCQSLSEISLPQARQIGEHAFDNCNKLSSVELPAVLSLDYFVFQNCTRLTSVSLPSAVSVCLSSFYGCKNLEEVFLPNVEDVDFNKALKNGKIYIGSTVQKINFQVVPTRMENGETQNIHEKHDIEIVLDSNGTYAESVLLTLEEVARNPEEYGTVTISYEDFSAISL